MTRSWIAFAVGIWILISPWLLGFADVSLAKWSSVACGLILVLMNAWALFAGEPANGGEGASSANVKKL